MSHKLALLVSMYNSGQWIENRLDNIFKSSIINDIQVYCINANSPDERDELIPKKFNISYIRTGARIPVYSAWNLAIRDTTAKYIANANTDDIVSPDCYEKLTSILDQDPRRGLSYSSWYTTAKENQQWPPNEIDPSQPGHYLGDIERAGVGHFPLWRRSLHDQIGLFDERFKALGDADWWARCYHVAKTQFSWLDECLGCYLWRSGENLWHKEINAAEWELYHNNVSQYKNQ